ncbi:MAG: efflux RND transporter permease subunit, partial [Myxococcales bacterium]|nr:efflux RND transporter permease subunit [Myxococcales bacterium]
LIIALGMLVDNAIVIVENIYRFLENGEENFYAADHGTREVGMAVVASTATTVAAFLPMMFWPGVIGEFMGFMPLTLIITLSCSLFVGLVINPVVTGYFARVEGKAHPPMRTATKVILAGGLAMVATAVGLVNQNVMLALAGGTLGVIVAHYLVMRHIARWFMERGLPGLMALYRDFLTWMLQRDYTVRFAYVRNMSAMVLFTAGILLAVAGGILAAAVGFDGAKVALLPAAALAGLGFVGILLHTVESVLLGGLISMAAGVVIALLTAGGLALLHLSGVDLDRNAQAVMAGVPIALFALGLIGWPLKRFVPRLILTDNRARLITGTLGGLFIIAAMFVVAPTGVEFFPDTDPNQVKVKVSGPLGANLAEGNRLAQVVTGLVDELLDKNPVSKGNVKNVVVSVGVGGDTMFGGGSASPEESVVTLNLVDFKDRGESSKATLVKLRDQLGNVPGADIEFTKDAQGPPTGPPVNIEIVGPQFAEVTRIASEVKDRLKQLQETGKVKGLVDVRDNLNKGRPEMEVVIKRERAAQFGLNTFMVASAVRTAVNGTEASKWRDGEDEYDIIVRLRPEDRADLNSLRDLTIFKEGQQTPLSSVADLKIGSGLGSITRKDGQRVVTIMANVAEGFNKQAVLGAVQAQLTDIEHALPDGYRMAYTGENQEQAESFGFLSKALAAGVSLILMILIAQFNSVLMPVIIMVAVGLSMIGVLLGLMVTRTPFSLFTFIGIISLAGIVVNNNIV